MHEFPGEILFPLSNLDIVTVTFNVNDGSISGLTSTKDKWQKILNCDLYVIGGSTTWGSAKSVVESEIEYLNGLNVKGYFWVGIKTSYYGYASPERYRDGELEVCYLYDSQSGVMYPASSRFPSNDWKCKK